MEEEQGTLFDNLRSLISLVDDLRDCGLQKYITLPRIATLGTQSAGKSSVMESIVGLDFLPRGEGVCTRRPLELRLVHLHDKQAQPWAKFEDLPQQKFTDFQEVKRTIEKLTDEVAGKNKGIVDDPIILNIHSPSCPDLSLIDLPGITRIPLKGSDQPENIEEITRNMCLKYIKDPRTIILCVIPANQDLTTSEGLQLARNVDKTGQRTLGVLTKIDIMDKGTSAKSILQNEEVPLSLGYVGVKLRSQLDIKNNVKVKEALKEEKNFFAKHPVYSMMPNGYLGTDVLSSRLTKILYSHIKNLLPEIMHEILLKLKYCDERLRELGTPLPIQDHEKIQMLFAMITDFCEIFKNLIRGRFDKRRTSSHITKGLKGGSYIKQLFHNLLNQFAMITFKATQDYTEQDIQDAIQYHQGDSIPGFPSVDVFTFLIQPKLEQLREPVEECVQEVHLFMENLAQKIVERIFYRFPNMIPEVSFVVSSVFNKEKENCLRICLSIIDSEENYLFTNDATYLERRTDIVPKSKNEGKSGGSVFAEEIRERIESYYKIVVKNVRDTIPKIVGTFLVRAVIESIQFELYKQINSKELIGMMGEPETVTRERDALKKTQKTLKEAQKIIRKEPDLAPQQEQMIEQMEKQEELKRQQQKLKEDKIKKAIQKETQPEEQPQTVFEIKEQPKVESKKPEAQSAEIQKVQPPIALPQASPPVVQKQQEEKPQSKNLFESTQEKIEKKIEDKTAEAARNIARNEIKKTKAKANTSLFGDS